MNRLLNGSSALLKEDEILRNKADQKNTLSRYIGQISSLLSRYLVSPQYKMMYSRYLEEQVNEEEFRKQLDEFIDKAEPPFKKRALVFGIEEARVEELLQGVGVDLLYQYNNWADGGFLREIEFEASKLVEDDGIGDKNDLLSLQDHISRMNGLNPLFMEELLLRKLEGKSTREEKGLLDTLNRLEAFIRDPSAGYDEHVILEGSYYDSKKRISVVLMDSGNWDDIYSFLQHEYTHCLIHERFFVDMLEGFNFVLSSYYTEDELNTMGGIKDITRARNKFFSLYNILDESFAYLSERFTGRYYDPGMICDSYGDRADTSDFRNIYELLSEVTEYMNQESFDRLAMNICRVFAGSWREESTLVDYKNTMDTIREMIYNNM